MPIFEITENYFLLFCQVPNTKAILNKDKYHRSKVFKFMTISLVIKDTKATSTCNKDLSISCPY